MDDFEFAGKKVLLRVDINSPIDPISGTFLDDSRIKEHVQTMKELEDSALVVMAHQSKPGKKDFTTMEGHARQIEKNIGRNVKYVDSLFSSNCLNEIDKLEKGDVLLLENTRLYAEEVALANKDIKLQASSMIVSKLYPHFNYFINDAFAAAHRSQPTLVGFYPRLPMLAGRLMEREITMLGKAVDKPDKPVVVVLGGMKVDDSIDVMKNMLDNNIADNVLTTGLVASMGLISTGVNIGKANLEFIKKEVPDYHSYMKTFYSLIKEYGDAIKMPTDVVLNDDGHRLPLRIGEKINDKLSIYDIGLDTIVEYSSIINQAGTIIANGPAGVFELNEFAIGTRELFMAIGLSKGYSVLGGGHTGVVAKQLGIADKVGHISTGGGAAINFLAGREMPVINALKASKKMFKEGKY